MTTLDLVARVQHTERHFPQTPQVGTNLAWAAYHLDAARVGQGIANGLAAGNVATLQSLLGADWEGLETAAMSLGCGDITTALDLCADAVYLASGGTPSSKKPFKTVRWWGTHSKQIATLPSPLQDWLNDLLSSSEWDRLLKCRDAIAHRTVTRDIPIALAVVVDRATGLQVGEGSATRSLAGISLAMGSGTSTSLGDMGTLISQLLPFGEDQFWRVYTALEAAYL